jgi:glycosyltransferase involved in cell wall biosynthesis
MASVDKEMLHSNASRTVRIGYLLRMYPRFSQTFVANEIAELEREGCEVQVLSLRTPSDENVHEAASRVKARVEYLPETRPSQRRSVLRMLAEPWRADRSAFARTLRILRGAATCEWDDLVRAVEVLRWAEENRLGHVHVHFGTSEATVALLAKVLGGLSYSLTLHAFDVFRDNVDRPLLAQKINHSKFTITVTEFNRRYLVENLPGVEASRIRVNYNGIAVDHFARERFPPTTPVVFGLGRLIEKKGFAHLVAAVARLRDQGLPIRCRIGGTGPESRRLQEQIEFHELQSLVELVGSLGEAEVVDELRRATCFVLPCVRARDGNLDALPTVLLEAQAAGCPVVTTRLSGNPEIIEDGVSGLLVEPEDDAALADAIRRVVCDARFAEALADGGRKRCAERFDIRRNVAVMHHWFRQAGEATERSEREPEDSALLPAKA